MVVIPSECKLPADTASQLAPTGPDTNTGDDTLVVELVPSCPEVFRPQPQSVPSDLMASVCCPWLLVDTCSHGKAAPGVDTVTGDDIEFSDVKLPTCPEVFWPHPYSTPVVVIASECDPPAATDDHDVVPGPETSTGEKVFTTFVIPTCPDVFCPHPYKRPAEVIANECDPPAAITDHDVWAGPSTATGTDCEVVLLMPSCPAEFKPHAVIKFWPVIPSVCAPPALIFSHDCAAGV